MIQSKIKQCGKTKSLTKFMKSFLFQILKRSINWIMKKIMLYNISFMLIAQENIISIIIFKKLIRFMMKSLELSKEAFNKSIMIALSLEMLLLSLKLSLRRKPSLKLSMNLKKKGKLENILEILKNQSLLRKLQSQEKLFIKTQNTVITKSQILLLAGDSVSFSCQLLLLFSTYCNSLRPIILSLQLNRWSKILTPQALKQEKLLPQ